MSTTPTVLVVEDEEAYADALTIGLAREGFTVLWARDGQEGVELFQKNDVDVILLDLMLPKMSGFDVCRSSRAPSDVPIIVVSARGDTDDVVRGLDAGADDYVTKPFELPELIARIRAHLRRRPAAINRFTVGELEVIEVPQNSAAITGFALDAGRPKSRRSSPRSSSSGSCPGSSPRRSPSCSRASPRSSGRC